MLNTKDDILKNRTVVGPHWLNKTLHLKFDFQSEKCRIISVEIQAVNSACRAGWYHREAALSSNADDICGWNFHIFTSSLIIDMKISAFLHPLRLAYLGMYAWVSKRANARRRTEKIKSQSMTGREQKWDGVRAWQKGRELWHALICANRSSLGKQPGFVDSQKAPSAIYPFLSITCYDSSGPLPLLHQWHLHNNYARQSQSITEIYIDASMSRTLVDAAALSK